MIGLAYVLGVAPPSLLVPLAQQAVRVSPNTLVAGSTNLWNWMAGTFPMFGRPGDGRKFGEDRFEVNFYYEAQPDVLAAAEDRLPGLQSVELIIRHHILPTFESRTLSSIRTSDVQSLADAVGTRYRALVVLIAGTGMRPGEALGLTSDRVGWLRRRIRIDRQMVTLANAAPKFGPVKTESSLRTVAVPQLVLDELAQHIARHGAGVLMARPTALCRHGHDPPRRLC